MLSRQPALSLPSPSRFGAAATFAAARSSSSSSRPADAPRLQLFSKQPPNGSRKQQIVATTVREALDVTFASGIIKDRGFADGAAVHVVDVQVSKDGLLARVLWEPMDGRYDAARVERSLRRKRGILRQHVNSYLNQKWAIQIEFVEATDAMQPLDERSALFEALRADIDAHEARQQGDEAGADTDSGDGGGGGLRVDRGM